MQFVDQSSVSFLYFSLKACQGATYPMGRLIRDRLGGTRDRDPPRFFLNNVRSVTGIDVKLGIHCRTSILCPDTKFWKIL